MRGVATGFTLLEMLVVIGILGLVAGLGYPVVSGAIDAQAFETATRQIELTVRHARADAIRQQRTVTVPSFASGRGDAAVMLAVRPLSPTIKIDQPDRIVFFRDGTARGGVITLSAGRRVFRIVIDSQTGGVTASGR